MTPAEQKLKTKLEEERAKNLVLEDKNRQLELAMARITNEANAKLKQASNLNQTIQDAFSKAQIVTPLPGGIPAGAR